MSDYERRVLERAANIPREQADAERARLTDEEQARRLAFEQSRALEHAMQMGMVAVRLLVERNIAFRPVFEKVVIGKKTRPGQGLYSNRSTEVDDYGWVQAGNGLHIYRQRHVAMGGTSNKRIGLLDDGRLFETDVRDATSQLPLSADDYSNKGIDVTRWVSAGESEEILNSEYFETGLAHLISDMRIPSFKSEASDIY